MNKKEERIKGNRKPKTKAHRKQTDQEDREKQRKKEEPRGGKVRRGEQRGEVKCYWEP